MVHNVDGRRRVPSRLTRPPLRRRGASRQLARPGRRPRSRRVERRDERGCVHLCGTAPRPLRGPRHLRAGLLGRAPAGLRAPRRRSPRARYRRSMLARGVAIAGMFIEPGARPRAGRRRTPGPGRGHDARLSQMQAGRPAPMGCRPPCPSRSAAQDRAVPRVAMMLSKTDRRSVPRLVTAVRMKVERIAPIKAYSMAVAPRRQAESREIRDRR